MKFLGWGLMLVLLLAALAAALQTAAYFQLRRTSAFDEQQMFHGGVFHVVTVVELGPDQELLPAVRSLVEATRGQGARVIYAGKIVAQLSSAQLPEAEWSAWVLSEFSSREAYDDAGVQQALASAREPFAKSVVVGMNRPTLLNLLIPSGLLSLRVADLFRGAPDRLPFTEADLSGQPPEARARLQAMVDGLLANRQYGERGVVVLNLAKDGSAAQQDANSGYGLEMLRLMAEARCGPMHIGDAVTLEGELDYDSVAIVYYPGVEFFADMVRSEFYQAIVGGKQLGDTLAAPSVPLLPHL